MVTIDDVAQVLRDCCINRDYRGLHVAADMLEELGLPFLSKRIRGMTDELNRSAIQPLMLHLFVNKFDYKTPFYGQARLTDPSLNPHQEEWNEYLKDRYRHN